ncbi:MAG: carbohydrate kinase family protein [Caldilineales bacterium]|nr:carbohydrate kinase family protein [Caldilineales bacterium]MDW8319669.1 carbohydrate kinase family protein [Anaerolineae bacterium]
MRVLSAGFVCGDLVLRPVDSLPPADGNLFVEQAALTIGGCAANAAVAFRRLLAEEGGVAAIAGRVGDDPLGRLLRDALAAEGVDTAALLATPDVATAVNTALVTSSGGRSFYVFPGACARLGPDDLPDSLLMQFDHLHLAAIGALPGLAGDAAADVACRARALGLTVSLDITLNPPRDTAADVLPLLPHVDLFLPNLAEAQAALGGQEVDELLSRGLAYGVRLMGLKLGERGSALATRDRRAVVPAFPVAVVDTVGAGDAWSAAVVYGWRHGWSLERIGRFANAAGALATMQPGAIAGLATAAEIRRFAGL